MRKEKVKKLLKLIKQWSKAEVMSRIGVCKGLAFGDYFSIHIDKKDKIRELLYGTSDLVELGKKWGLPLVEGNDEKNRRKKKTKQEA